MSKRSRPWDRKVRGPPAPSLKKKRGSAAVPFVEIASARYYSDRFYLNRTIHHDKDTTKSCQCGANDPPPLFHRSALVASLNLKLAILGTYTLDPSALVQEMPSLFGSEAKVPTLVLHGQKGWTHSQFSTKSGSNPEYQQESESPEKAYLDEESVLSPPAKDVFDDDCTINTQDDETLQVARSFTASDVLASPLATPQKEDRKQTPCFPETVHCTEITSSWVHPANIPASGLVDSLGGLSEAVLSVRENRRGVHHPKFMLLIENSGSLVVVVSTANLTTNQTTDGTWLQRFPSASSSSTKGTSDRTNSTSDFGASLVNFLHCQMLSSREGQLTTLAFVDRYLGWKSLRTLEQSFSFQHAQVHLIPTVPGDHDGQRGRPHSFLYGRQRVEDVLHQLTTRSPSTKPWLPPQVLSDNDRLIFQPTSFGAEWTRPKMSDVLRSYMGHTNLKQLDIVWPTDYFVNQAARSVMKSPDAVVGGFALADASQPKETERENSGWLFLSSDAFNRISLDCLSQMVLYEPSGESSLVPHIKSVARLFQGKDYRLRKDYDCRRSQSYFSWYMLTSACLSLGAQGDRCSNPSPGSDAVAYANFELGVLFASRLQKDASNDRLYCWKPAQCSCKCGSSTGLRLIHLPIPFRLCPARYQENEEEAAFCETPYFHEMLPSSVSCGHMLLTPHGAAVAAKQEE